MKSLSVEKLPSSSSASLWQARIGPLMLTLGVLLCSISVGTDAVADSGTSRVQNVELTTPADGEAEVLITTEGEPTYSARVAQGGTRLLFDISNSKVVGAPAAIIEGNDIVAGVMTQAFEGERVTRILIQLESPASYLVEKRAPGLVISLAKADKTGPMGAHSRAAALRRGGATPAPAPRAAVPTKGTVADVRFEHQQSLDRVILKLAASASVTAKSELRQTVFEIRGAILPSALERTLDTSAFGGVVRSVSTFRRPNDPSVIVVEVSHEARAKHVVTREGHDIVLSLSDEALPSTMSGIGLDGGVARKTQTVSREADYDLPIITTTFEAAAGAVESETVPDQADAFLPTMAGQQRFTGRRIDLDLKDADIHNVLRLLADVGRVNIVTADNVSGSVTIRMRNVPWDQALETVLQAKGLGMVRTGNMIRVAPIADLNKERELAIARRKSDLELAPIETRLIPVSYADAADLQQRAGDLISPRGSVAVDARTNVIIARDVAGNLNQIEELIRSLDTQTPQVLIEARIVEATSRYLRDVGIQWGGDVTMSPATGNDTGVAFPNSIGVVGGASDQNTPTAGLSPFQNSVANPNFAVNLPAIVGTGQGGAIGLSFGSINNTVNLNVRLSAAESSGMLRIISSPRILTIDNRDARISQGTLIPFSQISAQGVQTTFQEAKLQLLVRPHVTADGSVNMHVKINRDEPDFNQTSARGDPTILKREAETDLLIQDGHTAVIGGIFTRNTGRNLDQVPLLGDIPILGVLFQRRRASDQRSELVIFLTPRIVNRAEALGR